MNRIKRAVFLAIVFVFVFLAGFILGLREEPLPVEPEPDLKPREIPLGYEIPEHSHNTI